MLAVPVWHGNPQRSDPLPARQCPGDVRLVRPPAAGPQHLLPARRPDRCGSPSALPAALACGTCPAGTCHSSAAPHLCASVCLHLRAAAFPVAMNIDPSTGAAPSLGQGLTFAINPCSEEYHFGLLGEPRGRRKVVFYLLRKACPVHFCAFLHSCALMCRPASRALPHAMQASAPLPLRSCHWASRCQPSQQCCQ